MENQSTPPPEEKKDPVLSPEQQGLRAISGLIKSGNVMTRFNEILGKKTPGFIASIIQIVSGSKDLQLADPQSVINAAVMAAILDLPINNNLQFVHIIAYKDRHRGNKQFAQMQIGWRGFVQLAQRSEKFKTINVNDVREGELVSRDRLTGECVFKWVQDDVERDKLPVIGFVSYFKLGNGFEKMLYRTVHELQMHGKKYSKTYDREDGKWNTDFFAMCAKTLIKEILQKWAPLSIEMSYAIQADQSVMLNEGKFEYPDNPTQDIEHEDLTGKDEPGDKVKEAEEALKKKLEEQNKKKEEKRDGKTGSKTNP